MSDPKTVVARPGEWARVAKDLEAERFKVMSYDHVLISLFGDVKGKNVLDYGAGPGILALGIKKMGGNIKVWDIDPEMRRIAGEKIGRENIYERLEDVPKNFFDIIICNLVLCINPEDEVKNIMRNIRNELTDDGFVYAGFCNPKIFDVPESNLDLRFQTGDPYEENHDYKKIKKEGGYEIIESHRPIEWYEKVFEESGLNLESTHFTPEYELKGRKIRDFIIFKLG